MSGFPAIEPVGEAICVSKRLMSASKLMSISRLSSASSVLPRALNNSLPPLKGSPEAESRNHETWAYNQSLFHGAWMPGRRKDAIG